MKPTTLIAILVLISGQLFGQSVHKMPLRDKVSQKSYPIDGTPFLHKQYQQAAEYARAHPDFLRKGMLQKTVAWNFTVGNAKNWWVYNVNTDTYYQDPSTCRSVGIHCYIFVEDSMWTTGKVTQAAVDSIENDFDNKTPANPAKGIYDSDVNAFGNPPDVDSDPKIIILICDIQDGYNGTGGYIAGFFDPLQETTLGHSNVAEIYYVDANPTDLTASDGVEIAMSTAAHEFQHMIFWNYNKTKTNGGPTFINEGCSMLAELNCGYPVGDLARYANETNIYLFNWRTNDNTLVLNDYARAQRFNLYLWDRYGIGIFKYIVGSTQTNEISILNDALTKDSLHINFNNVFSNWLIANELNDTTTNRLYGYAYKNLPASSGPTFFNPNVSRTDTIKNVGARYIIFKGGSNLSVTFSNPSNSSNLSVQAIEMGSGSKNVVSVPFGTPFTEPNFGSIYTTIAFAVINQDPNNSVIYSYQASGTAQTTVSELKWDNTEPSGYYQWATGDTMCVTFDAYPGGTLDSIRVALRRPGSIKGGIYQLATSGASPLGRLLTRDTATITTSITLVNNSYPVPWPNWTTVKLSSYNISTDQAFAVAFVSGPDPSTPGVMVTDYPSTGAYHNFTYINASEASPSPAGWYYISSGTDTIALYLIRAYVRFTTGVTQEVSPMPLRFSLGQNYPNPFNPSTEITYQLGKASQVMLSVYDILGREVAVLVDKRQVPGKYSVTFDASTLPSGVYFYRLTTADNVAVQKMVFLK
jgi:hypothetical protein